ncbi:LPD7 domain-containing protein [Erwinia amylovora]|uniref:LPD7 domain-containing protein n=3 Tax=Erwinia amylovora TaxID=552 RepID=UPI000C07AFB8|nr:LPD7 domain-containing protein [Erwinia amylovora]
MKTADYPVWLAVLPDQRDAASADAGKHPDGGNAIKWDKEAQLWYARPGADLNVLQKWMPDRSIRSSGGGNPEEEFLDALTAAGLELKGLPVMDGNRHRVSVVDGKKGNRDGVYRGFLDGVKPAGWFINYHTAENDKDITRWKASGGTDASPAARVHIRAAMRQSQDDAAREQASLYAKQTAKAHYLYQRLPAADPAHAYLERKGITLAEDVRQTRNGALVVPFHDVDGAFRTLQYIPPDGEKFLFKDAPKVGHFRVEGGELRNGEPVLYAEGYATARSLYMVTGRPVVMTIDAGNMEEVAGILKARYPDSPHLFMADVDHAKKKNKGVLSANRAAEATGGAVLLPDLTPAEIARGFTDFNDLHQSRGAAQLRETLLPDIAQALEQLNYKDPPMATPDDAPIAPDATAETTVARRPGAAKEKTDDILRLRDAGLKGSAIAEQLGLSQTSVYRILRAEQPESGAEATPQAPVAVPESSGEPPVETVPAGASEELSAAIISEIPSDAALPEPAPPQAPAAVQESSGVPPAETVSAGASEELPAAIISEIPSDAALPEPGPSPVADVQPAPGSAENIARAIALSGSGLSLARVAAEMNLGMRETQRLILTGKQQGAVSAEPQSGSGAPDFRAEFSDINDSKAIVRPPEENGEPQAERQVKAEGRSEPSASPLASAFGEENAILVGAPRVAPQDEDKPASSGPESSRIDADKLLSRVTHEKQPDGQSVLYRLDGDPAFIDRGNRLVMAEGASAHEEKVLAALLTAANHYRGRIELTGSDAFKAFAIGVIVANKLDVSMKNAGQQADLDAARRAAGQPVSPVTAADTVRGEPNAPRANDASPVVPQTPTEQNTVPVTLSPQQSTVPAPVTPATQQSTGPAPVTAVPKIPAAVHTPAEKAIEPVTGKVTACGQAPFRFEAEQKESTFITLRTNEGQQTFWGKELAGLIRETNLQPGRMVTLQWKGEERVTVKVPKKNSEGMITHYEDKDTRRNQWSLTPAGGTRVQTGSTDMVPLAAVDVNRYTQIQHVLVSRHGLDIDAPPKPADGLYWLKPDGQGGAQSGDPLSAPRPAHNDRAGVPVMSAWGKDGQPDLLLVQGDGDYLQGVVRQNGSYHHVLVSLPGSAEAPPMVVNLLTPEGAKPIGSGNGINRSGGEPVAREHVVVRLTGDAQPRIAKLDAPADVPAALHARLGYDERYKAESGWVKEQPAAAPQAVPATPPRPAQ